MRVKYKVCTFIRGFLVGYSSQVVLFFSRIHCKENIYTMPIFWQHVAELATYTTSQYSWCYSGQSPHCISGCGVTRQRPDGWLFQHLSFFRGLWWMREISFPSASLQVYWGGCTYPVSILPCVLCNSWFLEFGILTSCGDIYKESQAIPPGDTEELKSRVCGVLL